MTAEPMFSGLEILVMVVVLFWAGGLLEVIWQWWRTRR